MPKGIYDRIKSKPNTGQFKKGHHSATEFKKGYIVSKKTKEKMRIAHMGNTNGFKKGQTGKKCLAWKGGKTKDKEGYFLIKKLGHPFRNNSGYVREQRLVVESQIGRYLIPKETCHHLNEIKDDNRPENLMAFSNQSAHVRFHKDPANVKPEEIIFDGRKLIK